jgi:HD-GYP domain-containing protein (c-di-GMP phosphodiesterase class II)
MLAGLCEAIDARPYMRGHGTRVGELAEAIALRLGWGADRLRRLRIGALLHDIGKLSVADTVWHKAERLTDGEVAAIRRHPAAGVRILARQDDFRFAFPQVLFHHERWDGHGYPSRRSGKAIPLEARILAVADAFDAMTSPRAYRPALETDKALDEIDRCAGSQFDPVLAGIFVELRAEGRRLLAAGE